MSRGSLPIQVGAISALYRYPVKSMGGERVQFADLGWFGLEGDRRFGLRRIDDRGGFPWLTAGKLPELILWVPLRRDPAFDGGLPTHVRTPEGEELEMFGSELAAEVGRRHGAPVEMMYLDRGIFDEASVSVMTAATVEEIGRLSSLPPDVRRFRPNVVITTLRGVPFEEDDWVGGVLSFGSSEPSPSPDHASQGRGATAIDGGSIANGGVAAVSVTHPDVRCSMTNLDPISGRPTPEILKVLARERDTKAGVYATTTRRGRLAVGQPVFFEPRG